MRRARRARARPDLPEGLPALDEPLPKFLDDPTAAKFMAALAADPDRRRRLMVELLARTGMRVGELGALETTPWCASAIPTGCASRSASSTTTATSRCTRSSSSSSSTTGPNADDPSRVACRARRRPALRPPHDPSLRRCGAKRAGIGHVHPHQLRHTLATQAINRGMSLEAIAAMLGHRSMDMTLVYARISDRTVADEYFKVTEAVEAAYRAVTRSQRDIGGPT